MTQSGDHSGVECPAIDREALLVEYRAANDVFMHYDRLAWSSGWTLMAGVMAFYGLLVVATTLLGSDALAIGFCVVTLTMSAWLLYAQHNRELYMLKLCRLWRIEADLGMRQHLGLGSQNAMSGGPAPFQRMALRGHHISYVVFSVASLGGPLLGLSCGSWSRWWLIGAAPIPIVLLYVLHREGGLRRWLDGLILRDDSAEKAEDATDATAMRHSDA